MAAQKLLLVENIKTSKNYKYYQGEDIIMKFQGGEGRVTDRILDMTDSTVIFDMMGQVGFSEISGIYRVNWMIEILRGLSLLGGAAYFGIDSFNRLINHDDPVILTETMLISGGLVAFSFALMPFKYRKINGGKHWRLRTIDLGSF
ncbi:MAG: hypothetical protein MUC31_04140 [Bacteroidales bacterium]|jgi:hypothetical protein|nr:hypothetical protein [Bacteroidales bacterium]